MQLNAFSNIYGSLIIAFDISTYRKGYYCSTVLVDANLN